MKMPHPSLPRHQRGVVLITSMLILVVMLIAAVALVRSFDTSLTTAGNLAFKRDVAQQSERVAQDVIALFRGAANPFSQRANRAAHNAARNYSASVLASNPQGIPLALLQGDPNFVPGVGAVDVGRGITLQYVVDRLCSEPGDELVLGPGRCSVAEASNQSGGSSSQWLRAENPSAVAAGGAGAGLAGALPQPIVYRLSVRATGPRNTQSFFQTTFACCDN